MLIDKNTFDFVGVDQAILRSYDRGRTWEATGTRVATFEPFPPPDEGGSGWLSSDGMSDSVAVNGLMYRRSFVTREIVEVGPLPEPDAHWVGDQATNRRLAMSLDSARFWFGPYDGPWQVELEPDEPMSLVNGRTFAANRLVFVTRVGTYIGDGNWSVTGEELRKVILLDATTGEPVGTPIEGVRAPSAALSSVARFLAVSSEASAFGDPGAVFVLDAATGAEIFRVEVHAVVNRRALVFDTAAGEVLAGTGEGQREVLTILGAGPLVEEVYGSRSEDRRPIHERLCGMLTH